MIQFYRPRSRFSSLEQNFLTDVLNLLFESKIPKLEKGVRKRWEKKAREKRVASKLFELDSLLKITYD